MDGLVRRLCVSFVVMFACMGVGASAEGIPGWEHGAGGLEQARKDAQRAQKPLLVLFRADWCKYCKILENDYLTDSGLRRFLDTIPKAELNPDADEADKPAAKQYGVTGYPSLYLNIPPFAGKPAHITAPFSKDGAAPTPEEFEESVRKEISDIYVTAGLNLLDARDYEGARAHLETGISFAPKNARAHCAMGLFHRALAMKDNAIAAWRDAEQCFAKALQCDPNDARSRSELDIARQAQEQMGSRSAGNPHAPKNASAPQTKAQYAPPPATEKRGPSAPKYVIINTRDQAPQQKIKVKKDKSGVETLSNR